MSRKRRQYSSEFKAKVAPVALKGGTAHVGDHSRLRDPPSQGESVVTRTAGQRHRRLREQETR